MDTRLVLADCREPLEPYLPGTSAQRAANFRGKINQVIERLTYSGKWKGAVVTVAFDSSAGFITLGPRFLASLAATYDRYPVQTFNQWHQYVECGPGTIDETLDWVGQLIDEGDGFVSTSDVSDAGSVRLYSTGADNGKTVRIEGIQQETGLPIYDNDGNLGEELVLSAPFVQSAYHYSSVTAVAKEATKGYVTMKILPSGGGSEYELSVYEPSETRPCYRRYKTGVAEKTIRILCQRRFFPVVAETDWVIPGNLAALKFGLIALNLEDQGYEEAADTNWNTAYKWLNAEAKSLRGGAKVPSGSDIWGHGQNLVRIN